MVSINNAILNAVEDYCLIIGLRLCAYICKCCKSYLSLKTVFLCYSYRLRKERLLKPVTAEAFYVS